MEWKTESRPTTDSPAGAIELDDLTGALEAVTMVLSACPGDCGGTQTVGRGTCVISGTQGCC